MKRADDILADVLVFPTALEAQQPEERPCECTGSRGWSDFWECPPCRDRRHRAQERAARDRAMGALRVTPKDRERIRSGQLEDVPALVHVRGWLESGGAILVLCGGVGTGKTVAGAWALWTHGGDGVQSGRLPQRLDPWGDERDRYRPLDQTGLVVLDDLGTEATGNMRWDTAFATFIDDRTATEAKTLITTNLRRQQIRERYGDRIAERINHVGTAVEIAGESMRRKGKV